MFSGCLQLNEILTELSVDYAFQNIYVKMSCSQMLWDLLKYSQRTSNNGAGWWPDVFENQQNLCPLNLLAYVEDCRSELQHFELNNIYWSKFEWNSSFASKNDKQQISFSMAFWVNRLPTEFVRLFKFLPTPTHWSIIHWNQLRSDTLNTL